MSTKISKAATLANLFIKLICSNGPKIELDTNRKHKIIGAAYQEARHEICPLAEGY